MDSCQISWWTVSVNAVCEYNRSHLITSGPAGRTPYNHSCCSEMIFKKKMFRCQQWIWILPIQKDKKQVKYLTVFHGNVTRIITNDKVKLKVKWICLQWNYNHRNRSKQGSNPSGHMETPACMFGLSLDSPADTLSVCLPGMLTSRESACLHSCSYLSWGSDLNLEHKGDTGSDQTVTEMTSCIKHSAQTHISPGVSLTSGAM